MQHITYADKSLLVGDEAAETLMEYAALLTQHQTGDTVKLRAIGVDGNEVVGTFLLDAGANIMAETTNSHLPEPDNSEALMRMRERIMRLKSPPQVEPMDETMPANYEDLNLE